MSKTTAKPPVKPADRSRSLATAIPRASAQRCAAQHMGVWAIESKFFQSAVDAIRSGNWKPELRKRRAKKAAPVAGGLPVEDDCPRDEWGDPIYVIKDSVAVISLEGGMTKHGSSFGGCSTVRVRHALRLAAEDYRVKAVLLHFDDCPGGTCAGTGDLADDVRAVREGKIGKGSTPKRVLAYASDMVCSAGYWVASQCESIHCNASAIVGSIGTYTVLTDDTAAQESWGVKYKVVSTGPYKGLGADGKVTDALVADVQREVDELNAVFLGAVKAGRGSKIPDLAKVTDGRAWVGTQAQSLGLVDGLLTFDAALALAATPLPPPAAIKPAVATPAPAAKKQNTDPTPNPPVPAGNGGNGTPAPKAGKSTKSADTGGERSGMNPKKKDYLVSLGLKADATDEEAQAFYDLLNDDKKAEADGAETDVPSDDGAGTGGAGASKADDTKAGKAAAKEAAAVAGKPGTWSEIVAACDGDKSAAGDYFEAGMTVAQAKAAYAGIKAEKDKTAKAEQKAAQVEFKQGGQKALATAGGGKKPDAKADDTDAEKIKDPKARAKAEWDANLNGCREGEDAFISEKAYIGYRSADLRGNVKTKVRR